MADRIRQTWSVEVNRPQPEVFDYLADVSRHSEWSPKPFRVDNLTPGPVTVGTTYTSYGWIPGDKEHRNDCEVITFDAPKRLVIRSREKDQDFINTFTLTAQNGSTKVEREMDMPKPGGLVGVMMPVIMATVVRPGVQKGMNMFKENLER